MPLAGTLFCVQRTFTGFPDGLPGIGLFILRSGLAAILISPGIINLQTAPQGWITVLTAVLALLLVIGLFTPILAVVGLALALCQLTSNPASSCVASALCLSLAMVGPGSYSIDFRLYGRKRITIR